MGLSNFMSGISKELGVKAETPEDSVYEKVSTGSMVLDLLTEGGIPRGVLTEISGEEGGGKTTTCLKTAANFQKLGLDVLYIDAEKRLNMQYAQKLGVNIDPDHFVSIKEDQTEVIQTIIQRANDDYPKNNIGLIVIDSVAGVVPDSWTEDDGKSKRPGDRAQFWSDFAPLLASFAHNMNAAVILVNQHRTQMGSAGGANWKTTIEPMGGKGIRYFKSLAIELNAGSKDFIETKDVLTGEKISQPVGVWVYARIGKSTVCKAFQRSSLYIKYGEGVDNYQTAMQTLIDKGLIKKQSAATTAAKAGARKKKKDNEEKKDTGNTFVLIDPETGSETTLGLGYDRALEKLRETPKLVAKLINNVVSLKGNYFGEDQ